MSNVVEQLKARRRHETVLTSGLKVGFHYPDVEECILKVGQIPLADMKTLPEMSEGSIDEAKVMETVMTRPDLLKRGYELSRSLVAAMLEDIDGEEVTDENRDEVVGLLEPQDREELYLIANRERDPETGKAL